jgi:hypothetical protein
MGINELVEKLIAEHVGGERFFDNLDAAVRNEHYVQQLWRLHVQGDYYGYEPGIVLTGKFGNLFANWLSAYKIKRQVFILDGGIRHKDEIDDLCHVFASVGGEYVLFDDSLYSGKTRDLIANHLAYFGGKLTKTYVVYDGSHERDDSVVSLYRYHE